MIAAADLKMALADRAEEFARWLLPNGRKQGGEWLVGSLNGEAGQSLRICLSGAKAGVFRDFASGEGGDNLVELYRQRHGVEFVEALRACAAWLGEPLAASTSSNPRPLQKQAEKPASYQPTDEERQRWMKACDTLASDPERCEQVAKTRHWKTETVRDLAVEGSLGIEDNKLVFLYDTGAKIRFRQQGEKVIYWLFGKPFIWRGAYLSIPSRTKIFLCEGETDAIALLDAGAEKNDPAKLVVAVPSASTFNEKWARLFTGKDVLLCFNNDAAGNAAVDRVGKFLQGHARTIRAIDWEGINRAYG